MSKSKRLKRAGLIIVSIALSFIALFGVLRAAPSVPRASADGTYQNGWINRGAGNAVETENGYRFENVAGWGSGLTYFKSLDVSNGAIVLRINLAGETNIPDGSRFGFSFVKNPNDYGPESGNYLSVLFVYESGNLGVYFTSSHLQTDSVAYYKTEDGTSPNIGGRIDGNYYNGIIYQDKGAAALKGSYIFAIDSSLGEDEQTCRFYSTSSSRYERYTNDEGYPARSTEFYVPSSYINNAKIDDSVMVQYFNVGSTNINALSIDELYHMPNSDIDRLENKITDLQNTITSLRVQLGDAQHQVDEKERIMTGLRLSINENAQQIAALNLQISELEENAELNAEEIAVLNADLEALENEKAALEGELSEITGQKELLESEIELLRAELEGREAESSGTEETVKKDFWAENQHWIIVGAVAVVAIVVFIIIAVRKKH